jgi:hypothetical protein
MEPIEQLEQLIRELNSVQITLLLEMARAMTREIQEDINEQSDLLVPEFATDFSNRLLIHHALMQRNLVRRRLSMLSPQHLLLPEELPSSFQAPLILAQMF